MLKLVQFREHHKLVRIIFYHWHKVPHLWRSYNSYSLSVRHSTVLTLKTSISWQWKPPIECVFDRVGSAAGSSRVWAGLLEEVVIIHLHLVLISRLNYFDIPEVNVKMSLFGIVFARIIIHLCRNTLKINFKSR